MSDRDPEAHSCHCTGGSGHPADILQQEHDFLLKVLAALEQELARMESGKSVRLGFWVRTFDFLEHFADRCHHGKEEEVLFPALERAGVRHEHGPTAVMRAEHEEARLGRARMTEALQSRDVRWLCVAVGAYIDLMRRHIRKENDNLLPMTRQLLSADEARQVRCAFHAFEREDLGDGARERYLDLGRDLCAEVESLSG